MLRYLLLPFLSVGLLFYGLPASLAQNGSPKIISMDHAVSVALGNNPLAKSAELKVQSAMVQRATPDIGSTEFNYQYGQVYGPLHDRSVSVTQNFGLPFSFTRKFRYNDEVVKLSEAEQKLAVKQITANVKTGYTNWLYQFSKLKLIRQEVDRYEQFMNMDGKLRDLGDSGLLERTMIETKYANIQNLQFQTDMDYRLAINQMQQLLFQNGEIAPSDSSLELYAIQVRSLGKDKFVPTGHIAYYQSQYEVNNALVRLEQSKLSPGVTAGYFNQQINHVGGFEGFKVGLSVPLWFLPQKAKISEASINRQIAKNELEYQQFYLAKTIESLKIQLDQYFVSISYYRENALIQADLLISTASRRFKNQNMGSVDYLESLSAALKLKLEYLEKVKLYNQTAIQLEYYVN
jgi:heavy metal efflux system protein